MTSEAPAADTAIRSGTQHQHDHGHRDVSGGWLRPAVFGAMDGLVTNASLVAGISGGGSSRHTVLLTGFAGLVAGAFSMATGEYTSVKSQNESILSEVEIEALELRRHPEAEVAELAESFVKRGLDRELALQVADQLSRDPVQALQEHSQAELGVNPDALPSPWMAAGSSFVCFAIGALLPLVTYLFGLSSLWPALIVSAVSLLAAGAITAGFTGRPRWYGGARQLLLGALAAGVTYLVGRLIGAQVS